MFQNRGLMKYLRIAALCIAGCAWGLAAPSGAQDWKMSAMVSYDTGKYGTSDHTSSFYIPLTLKRYFDKSSASVTVPYLRQSSTGQVVRVGGSPVRVNKVRTAAGSSSQVSCSSTDQGLPGWMGNQLSMAPVGQGGTQARQSLQISAFTT